MYNVCVINNLGPLVGDGFELIINSFLLDWENKFSNFIAKYRFLAKKNSPIYLLSNIKYMDIINFASFFCIYK